MIKVLDLGSGGTAKEIYQAPPRTTLVEGEGNLKLVRQADGSGNTLPVLDRDLGRALESTCSGRPCAAACSPRHVGRAEKAAGDTRAQAFQRVGAINETGGREWSSGVYRQAHG